MNPHEQAVITAAIRWRQAHDEWDAALKARQDYKRAARAVEEWWRAQGHLDFTVRRYETAQSQPPPEPAEEADAWLAILHEPPERRPRMRGES